MDVQFLFLVWLETFVRSQQLSYALKEFQSAQFFNHAESLEVQILAFLWLLIPMSSH